MGVASLQLDVEVIETIEPYPPPARGMRVTHRWLIAAPWLAEPVEGATFEAAYALAMQRRN